jgi:hypothetical protein
MSEHRLLRGCRRLLEVRVAFEQPTRRTRAVNGPVTRTSRAGDDHVVGCDVPEPTQNTTLRQVDLHSRAEIQFLVEPAHQLQGLTPDVHAWTHRTRETRT